MSDRVTIEFAPLAAVGAGAAESVLVVFAAEDMRVSAATQAALGTALDQIRKAAAMAKFKGQTSSSLDILAPAGLPFGRLLVAGVAAKKGADRPADAVMLGGYVMGKVAGSSAVSVLFDLPDAAASNADGAADFALGARLRSYKFDLYKTKKKDDEARDTATTVTIGVADPAAARQASVARDALAGGVIIARDLVNEPANILYPAEFANRTRALETLGVKVEILDQAALEKIGMRTLLGVGQGSRRESQVAIMRWNGASDPAATPLAFIGKGVCFDTGGISIKPAASMEDMKGDMGGAACVTGLIHTLAARKAKVNAIGVIGLVENMPDGNAQRPGDIVKSLSGQTVEVINTDAEGRLVLADLLWYVQDQYKPKFMINLATLTGAIVVALGQEHAGLFANNDELAARLTLTGLDTGEKVWRMPLAPAYDKMLDSKFADMKNIGGRNAGSITAAQFLQRFVNDTPWAHLDIAGTAMGSPQTDINQSWGSGWGVRLLDRLVAGHYEG